MDKKTNPNSSVSYQEEASETIESRSCRRSRLENHDSHDQCIAAPELFE